MTRKFKFFYIETFELNLRNRWITETLKQNGKHSSNFSFTWQAARNFIISCTASWVEWRKRERKRNEKGRTWQREWRVYKYSVAVWCIECEERKENRSKRENWMSKKKKRKLSILFLPALSAILYFYSAIHDDAKRNVIRQNCSTVCSSSHLSFFPSFSIMKRRATHINEYWVVRQLLLTLFSMMMHVVRSSSFCTILHSYMKYIYVYASIRIAIVPLFEFFSSS